MSTRVTRPRRHISRGRPDRSRLLRMINTAFGVERLNPERRPNIIHRLDGPTRLFVETYLNKNKERRPDYIQSLLANPDMPR